MNVKRFWKWAVGLALLTAAAVWYLHARLEDGFDWTVFAATLAGLHWGWLGLSALFALSTYYGRALRWAVLLRPVKRHPRMWSLFSATAIGFTAITLLGRPGEFVRPYLIAVKERVPLSSQLAAWLIERIYDLLMALLVFGFALSKVHQSGVVVGPRLTWVLSAGGYFVGVLALASLVLLILIRQFSEPMRLRLLAALQFLPAERLERAERLVNSFVQGVAATRTRSAVLLLVFYTVLEWALIAASTLCLVRAFQGVLQFGMVDVLIFMGFVAFGGVVQIPGVGGGVQVVSVIVLTELFGVSFEAATSVAMLLWLTTFVIIVPFGVALALHEGLNWGKLRHLEQEVEG